MYQKECKYAKMCKLYSNTSVTCTEYPNEYCGKLREFANRKTSIIKNIWNKLTIK